MELISSDDCIKAFNCLVKYHLEPSDSESERIFNALYKRMSDSQKQACEDAKERLTAFKAKPVTLKPDERLKLGERIQYLVQGACKEKPPEDTGMTIVNFLQKEKLLHIS